MSIKKKNKKMYVRTFFYIVNVRQLYKELLKLACESDWVEGLEF